jgi:hypothetical protein
LGLLFLVGGGGAVRRSGFFFELFSLAQLLDDFGDDDFALHVGLDAHGLQQRRSGATAA